MKFECCNQHHKGDKCFFLNVDKFVNWREMILVRVYLNNGGKTE